jgi:hypothetical protein
VETGGTPLRTALAPRESKPDSGGGTAAVGTAIYARLLISGLCRSDLGGIDCYQDLSVINGEVWQRVSLTAESPESGHATFL